MKNVLRWIMLLPVTFAFAALAGAMVNIGGQFIFGNRTIPSAVIWCVGGMVSSATWMGVGMKLAPVSNNVTKWILLTLLMIVSLLSTIGSVMGLLEHEHPPASLGVWDQYWGGLFLGISMFVVSIFFIRMEPEDISR